MTGSPPCASPPSSASRGLARGMALALLVALALSSCAYYNTFYLARKNYYAATLGEPYLIAGTNAQAQQRLSKAVDYAKKLIADYPKSKWVDDAYLLWARSLLGKDDPIQTVNMLQDFATVYPKSALKAEATFYLGVAHRQAHQPSEALVAFDDFLGMAKHHELTPYALLERSRVLMTLERPGEAASSVGQLIDQFPKSLLVKQARLQRAEALLAQGEHEKARLDFHDLGLVAIDDEERFSFLLREADCIEAAREYDREIDLLKSALSQEQVPVPPPVAPVAPVAPAATVLPGSPASGTLPPTTPSLNSGAPGSSAPASGFVPQYTAPSGPGADHYGRLRVRVGTANLLAGRLDKALVEYREVVTAYPRTPLAAEAQYRIGYAYETVADDFDKARTEYNRVKEMGGQGTYAIQTVQRLNNLDRLAQYRTASGKDSLEKMSEAGFMLAELYLFQLSKPERALEEYRRISDAHPGTPFAGKAINAQAWVLRSKLNRKGEADSLLWKVVHEYPATEAQVAARDYLETEGIEVPSDLIKLPEPKTPPPAPADTVRLTPPPQGPMRLGEPRAPSDSLLRLGTPPGAPPMLVRADSLRSRFMQHTIPGDSLMRARVFSDSARASRRAALGDTTRRFIPPAPADTTQRPMQAIATPDLSHRPARAVGLPDTTHRAATFPARPDTTHRALVPSASPDTTHRAPLPPAPPDIMHRNMFIPAPPEPTLPVVRTIAASDTTHHPAPPDTTRRTLPRAPADTTRWVGPPAPPDSTRSR